MIVEIKKFVAGPLENNVYIITAPGGQSCLIVDPAIGSGAATTYIRELKLSVDAILLTHGHFDHIMGIPEVLEIFPKTPVYAHPDEKVLITDPSYNGSPMIGRPFAFNGPLCDLQEGVMTIGSFTIGVAHVPGHSPGGCAFVFDGQCLTGDSLFAGSVGRTDFPGCDHDALIDNVTKKLLTLPDETILYSGHGGRTTVAREKRHNPFLS